MINLNIVKIHFLINSLIKVENFWMTSLRKSNADFYISNNYKTHILFLIRLKSKNFLNMIVPKMFSVWKCNSVA